MMLYNYPHDIYLFRKEIDYASWGIGITGLVLIFAGLLVPYGRPIVVPMLGIIQVGYFTLLAFDQLPLTYLGMKSMKYTSGYNINTDTNRPTSLTTG